MKTTRTRFVVVALVACFFAIGMATFLNYFKYKSTIGQIVKSRILVIGAGIENSVQSSLALGLSFAEIGTLPSLMEREKASDPLIKGIDIFDPSGRVVYSTDTARVGQMAPGDWNATATRSKRDWYVEETGQSVAGIALKNNFDLTVGYLALRYSRDDLNRNVAKVGTQLVMISAAVFLAVTVLLSLALVFVIRRFEQDVGAMEKNVRNLDGAPGTVKPEFAAAIGQFREAIRSADAGLAEVRQKLESAS